MSKSIKAVVLLSGGLDSMLAAKLLVDQGIHVEALNFYTGFCHSGHTSAIRKQKSNKVKRNDALWAAEQLGIKLHIVDIVEEYQSVLTNPKHGYGANLNPCLDCKIFMVQKALQWMREHNFDFIATGEVIGQRPKSQRKVTMPFIAKHSGANDYLLRPLCAQNLPPTVPEREGWVDRNKLLGITGRGRKIQLELAKQYQFVEHAQPAGGCCVLTDPNYTSRLNDLWQARGDKRYNLDDVIILKVGRHLRPNARMKIIVGREQGENNFMEGYRHQFLHLRIPEHDGPLVFVDGEPTVDDIQLAAQIAARFSDGKAEAQVKISVHPVAADSYYITVKPLSADAIAKEWYL